MSLNKYPYVIVFIPAYNEEASIGNVIKKIQEGYMDANKKGYWVDIMVIDDGSTDNTAKAAGEAGVKTIVTHPFNMGLGAATRTGLERAHEMGADIAVKIDADFQHNPDDIDKVVRPIIEDRADCVFGSRLMGGLKYKMPLHRALGNKFFSGLVSALTNLNITDAQTGLMAFSKRYIKDFDMISDYNETQQLIMDACGRHMRIIEVPVEFHRRETGRSFISWRYPFMVLPNIIRLFVRMSPLKVFIPLGLMLIAAGGAAALYILKNGQGFVGKATFSVLVIAGIQTLIFGLLADLVSKKK